MSGYTARVAVMISVIRAVTRAPARAGALVALAGLLGSCAGVEQRTFATPEEAAGAVMDAIRGQNKEDLIAILGEESREVLDSGDEVADWAARRQVLAAYEEKHRLEPAEDGAVAILHVGELDWPLPIPIVSTEDGWLFDTEAGKQELLNRRIGRNELNAMQACLAGVDAQREYVREDHDGDGILEYARKVRSSPGERDGLYWEAGEGEEPSPLGPLAAQAVKAGYSAQGDTGDPEPYHGYLYRILEAQGPHAPGGAYEYVVRENMIGGFAIVAYPARYGLSGIKTFAVSHDGVVHEKDLGDDTEKLAEEMTVFDPDTTWAVAAP